MVGRQLLDPLPHRVLHVVELLLPGLHDLAVLLLLLLRHPDHRQRLPVPDELRALPAPLHPDLVDYLPRRDRRGPTPITQLNKQGGGGGDRRRRLAQFSWCPNTIEGRDAKPTKMIVFE